LIGQQVAIGMDGTVVIVIIIPRIVAQSRIPIARVPIVIAVINVLFAPWKLPQDQLLTQDMLTLRSVAAHAR
jgi:hypothetical protein